MKDQPLLVTELLQEVNSLKEINRHLRYDVKSLKDSVKLLKEDNINLSESLLRLARQPLNSPSSTTTWGYEGYSVSFEDSQELRNKVFNRVLQFYRDHENFSGEGIMQCDSPLIDAPSVLAEIADDIMGFEIVEQYDY